MTDAPHKPPPPPPPGGWNKTPDLIGSVLADRYRIIRQLGTGGMASVYLAQQIVLKKQVAIKILHQRLCGDQNNVERFLREAQAASMIRHENVVDIIDFGQVPGGSVFIAMELLDGQDLDSLLGREVRLSWPRTRNIILQVIRALAAAHVNGIIHRDMKPANCYLIERMGNREFIKVLDFGIAKIDTSAGEGLTETGAVFGTAKYMAPEQACGEVVDPRTDVYALGVMMYELLTGRVPFEGDNFMRVLTRHMNEAPAPPRSAFPDADISPAVETVIMRALAKRPSDRYGDMQALEQAIVACDQHESALDQLQRAGVGGSPDQTVAIPGSAASLGQARGGTVVMDAPAPTGPREAPPSHPARSASGAAFEAELGRRGSGSGPALAHTTSTGATDRAIRAAGGGRSRSKSVVFTLVGMLVTMVGGFATVKYVLGDDFDLDRRSPTVQADTRRPVAPEPTPPPRREPERKQDELEIPIVELPASAEPNPASPRKDDSEVIESDGPSKPRPRRPKRPRRPRPKAKTPAKPKQPALPAELSGSQIEAGLQPARKAAKDCGDLATIKVRFTVEPKGRVTSARALRPHDKTPQGRCVENVVMRARFPRTSKTVMSIFTRGFKL